MTVLRCLLALSLLATPAVAQQCKPYRTSGPIKVTRDNQVIENLYITAINGPGIDINGFSRTKIRNVVICHANGYGIKVWEAPDTTITKADIVFTGAKPSGANSSDQFNNIDCYESENLTIRSVRLTRGSSGVYMDRCRFNTLAFIEGHDQRRPFPRGQLVQWNNSHVGTLSDFSNETSIENSFPEDNVNVYQTRSITISRGVVIGNNAPTGAGVMADEFSSGVLVFDVDAVRQMNACFGTYTKARNITFLRTRCRDTICTGPRGRPASTGLGWSIYPTSIKGGLKISQSGYSNLCNPRNLVWDERCSPSKT
jgi:hypothetical protein